MTRILIGLLHLAIAASTLAGVALWLLQMRLNAAWEQGFYGELSLVTVAGVLAVLVAGGLGVAQGVSGAGWMFGRSWAGYLLLGLSMFYIVILPAPLRWLVMAGGVSIFMELITRRAGLTPVSPTD